MTPTPEGFWDGDFTLGVEDGDARAAAPAIEGLGRSGITIGGRDLAVLLAPAYRRFTGTGSAPGSGRD
ncbi:hypothetical protein [Kitasatospora sp. NPDC059571]|uniref:hypothetical protein n=1 Tax=Kitasatospora sp. NPDC059571 TaxID=3346871 RepID=UPI0036BFEFCF